jgi:hypothetical protein
MQSDCVWATSKLALDLLVTKSGNVFAPVRGIGSMGTAAAVEQLSIGDELTLLREYATATLCLR